MSRPNLVHDCVVAPSRFASLARQNCSGSLYGSVLGEPRSKVRPVGQISVLLFRRRISPIQDLAVGGKELGVAQAGKRDLAEVSLAI